MKLFSKLFNLYRPEVYTKDFWNKVMIEFTTNSNQDFFHLYICNCSSTFKKEWLNIKNRILIIELARDFMKSYENEHKVLFKINNYVHESHKLFTIIDPSHISIFPINSFCNKSINIREHFIEYCIHKFK